MRHRRPTVVVERQQQQQERYLGSSMSSVSLSFSTRSSSNETPEQEQPQSHQKIMSPLLDTTEPCQGRLVARIMPKSFVEYEQRKPNVQCNQQEVLRLKRQATSVSEKDVVGSKSQHDYACSVIGSFGGTDNSWLSPFTEERIVALSVDIDCPVQSIDPLCTSVNNSDSSSVQSEEKLFVHLDLHMNRNAHEPAVRTLKRFEISMARRIQREKRMPTKHLARKELQNGTLISRKVAAGSCTSALLVPTTSPLANNSDDSSSSSDGDENDVSKDGYRTLDISEMTSEKLWKEIAKVDSIAEMRNSSTILSLSLTAGSSPIPLLVESCPPTIVSIKTFDYFGSQLFLGVPLVIQTEVLHATRAVVSWFANGVEVCHDSPCYTPMEADVGKELSVLVVPVRPGHDGEGHEEAYRFKNLVEPLPFMPLVSPLRDEWMERSDESFQKDLRVMTYNLLADLYTSREVDQQLMYNHCPPKFLVKSRRMPMLVYEILAYHADLICLQEVDASVFHSLLEPALASQGYQGYYSNKASSQLEGCAMFWSLKCFERADQKDQGSFCVRDLFGTDDNSDDEMGSSRAKLKRSTYSKWDSMDSIDNLLCQHDELRRVAREKVGQVLQVATLTLRRDNGFNKEKPKKLVVGNTHLFYHPMADHIRAMQAYVVCKQLDAVRRSQGDEAPPLVMCGDFNSNPLSGAVQVFLQRRLGPDHFETWKHLNEYSWEMGDYEFMVEHGYVGNDAETGVEPIYLDEAFEDAREYEEELVDDQSSDTSLSPPPLVLPSVFPNLFSGYQDMPEFTNLAIDFTETLDYILASEPSASDPFGFSPKRSAVIPTEAEVKQHVAMPNEFMPSDHVSLVCDLEWQKHHNNDNTVQ